METIARTRPARLRTPPRRGEPAAEALAIVRYTRERSVYLVRFDADESPLGDTWHDSVEAALAEAHDAYGVTRRDFVFRSRSAR